MTARRHALLLINTKSRQGAEQATRAAALLRDHGLDLAESAPDEPLPEAIRRHVGQVDLVVVGGGDGTLNAAAPALRETGLPLGILPLGTANDLARTLGIPLALEDAARIVAQGEVRRIDLGEVNGRPFFNVASIGLSVALTRELTGDLKRRWGRLGYALATFRALLRHRPFRAVIRADGQRLRVRTVQVSIGNGRHYGGGLTVDESAAIDDGMLHLYSIEVASLWKLALIYPAFRRGRHGMWREVRTLAAPEIEVVTRRRRRVNTDGEITTRTPAHFRVLRDAVAVIVPSGDVPGLSRG